MKWVKVLVIAAHRNAFFFIQIIEKGPEQFSMPAYMVVKGIFGVVEKVAIVLKDLFPVVLFLLLLVYSQTVSRNNAQISFSAFCKQFEIEVQILVAGNSVLFYPSSILLQAFAVLTFINKSV